MVKILTSQIYFQVQYITWYMMQMDETNNYWINYWCLLKKYISLKQISESLHGCWVIKTISYCLFESSDIMKLVSQGLYEYFISFSSTRWHTFYRRIFLYTPTITPRFLFRWIPVTCFLKCFNPELKDL